MMKNRINTLANKNMEWHEIVLASLTFNDYFSIDLMNPRLLLAFIAFTCSSCSDYFVPQILPQSFSKEQTPSPPDYNEMRYWAALPELADNADKVPHCPGCRDEQASATVDVFFIHPTLYMDTNDVSRQ